VLPVAVLVWLLVPVLTDPVIDSRVKLKEPVGKVQIFPSMVSFILSSTTRPCLNSPTSVNKAHSEVVVLLTVPVWVLDTWVEVMLVWVVGTVDEV